jgi:hypothetical protein
MTSASLLEQDFELDTFLAATGASVEGLRTTLKVDVSDKKLTIWVEGEPPRWLNKAATQIQSILRLRAGWDSYGSLEPNVSAAVAALQFLAQVMQEATRSPAIVPMSSGNVLLEWHASGTDIEVEVGPEGPVYASVEDAAGPSISEPIVRTGGLLNVISRRLPRRA